MAILHWRAYRSFTAGLNEEGNVSTDEWESVVRAWDEDMSKPSPYVVPDEG